MFEPPEFPVAKEGERICGTCMEPKSVDEFYKDGKDRDGEPKYRRDCKDCYRITRLLSRQAKRAPAPKPRPAKKRKKK